VVPHHWRYNFKRKQDDPNGSSIKANSSEPEAGEQAIEQSNFAVNILGKLHERFIKDLMEHVK